jgi:hypothetical protein
MRQQAAQIGTCDSGASAHVQRSVGGRHWRQLHMHAAAYTALGAVKAVAAALPAVVLLVLLVPLRLPSATAGAARPRAASKECQTASSVFSTSRQARQTCA